MPVACIGGMKNHGTFGKIQPSGAIYGIHVGRYHILEFRCDEFIEEYIGCRKDRLRCIVQDLKSTPR
jgi:hypothetical protein